MDQQTMDLLNHLFYLHGKTLKALCRKLESPTGGNRKAQIQRLEERLLYWERCSFTPLIEGVEEEYRKYPLQKPDSFPANLPLLYKQVLIPTKRLDISMKNTKGKKGKLRILIGPVNYLNPGIEIPVRLPEGSVTVFDEMYIKIDPSKSFIEVPINKTHVELTFVFPKEFEGDYRDGLVIECYFLESELQGNPSSNEEIAGVSLSSKRKRDEPDERQLPVEGSDYSPEEVKRRSEANALRTKMLNEKAEQDERDKKEMNRLFREQDIAELTEREKEVVRAYPTMPLRKDIRGHKLPKGYYWRMRELEDIRRDPRNRGHQRYWYACHDTGLNNTKGMTGDDHKNLNKDRNGKLSEMYYMEEERTRKPPVAKPKAQSFHRLLLNRGIGIK